MGCERTELDAVLSADGTTVDDPGGIGDGLRDGLGQPLSDIDVSLLGLLDRGDLAGSDSPNGFVGNDDVPVMSATHIPDLCLPSVDADM